MTTLFRTASVLTLVTALALSVSAQDEALSLVPANAVTVGVVHLAEMRTSPLSSVLFEHIDRMSSDGEAEQFLLDAGLQPLRDVDVLVVATSPRTNLGSEADILVVVEGSFRPGRLSNALISRGAVSKDGYITFPESESGSDGEAGAVAFLSPTLAIAGNERSVVNALAARANGGTNFINRGGLAMDLHRIAPGATAWALVDVVRASRLAKAGTIDTGEGQHSALLQGAMESVSAVALWATDTGDALQLGASGSSTDTETLELIEDAVRGALSGLRLMASEKAPEMVTVLRRFEIARNSDSVTVEGSIPAALIQDFMAKQAALAMKTTN